MDPPKDPAGELRRKLDAFHLAEYLEAMHSQVRTPNASAKRAMLEDTLKNLRHGLVGLPARHPLTREIRTEISRLAAELEPSRRKLLSALSDRGITHRQVAVMAWPGVHPDKAAARLKAWASYKSYPDGSPGDIAIRTAIAAFSDR
jgi:hypothetical protein